MSGVGAVAVCNQAVDAALVLERGEGFEDPAAGQFVLFARKIILFNCSYNLETLGNNMTYFLSIFK